MTDRAYLWQLTIGLLYMLVMGVRGLMLLKDAAQLTWRDIWRAYRKGNHHG